MTSRKYERTVTVAAVNWRGVWGDKAANFEKIRNKVVEASKAGIDIIAFPELSLSGYECGEESRRDQKPCAMHTDAAETIPGPTTTELARTVKDLGIYVILGLPEREDKNPEIHYNAAAVIGPEGILGTYRKINLSVPPIWTEAYCFEPGCDLPVFITRFGPIGVLICKDFWQVPECCRILYLKGARVVFNLAGSPAGPGKDEFMTHITACRAVENMIYTVSCNHVGDERTSSYYGCSTIAGPSYPRMVRVFAQGGWDSEEVVSATLSLEMLRHWENSINLKKEVNWKIIGEEYARLAGN